MSECTNVEEELTKMITIRDLDIQSISSSSDDTKTKEYNKITTKALTLQIIIDSLKLNNQNLIENKITVN